MKHESISRRQFLLTGAAGVIIAGTGCVHLKQSGHPFHPLPYSVQLRIEHPSKLRILQLTDVHWGTDNNPLEKLSNKRTAAIIADVMAQAKADLIIVTGDSWSGNRKPGGEERMTEVVAKYAALSVPWAYAWGNHDQLIDNNAGHKALTEAANSLYRGAATGGNYVIDVAGPHGNRVCQLVFLNSEVEGLSATQQAWMDTLAEDTAKAGDQQPLRFAFFHIPIKQYVDVWDSGAASGIKGEKQCIESEDGSSLAYLKMLGARACFCGHDHVNNYSGKIDGVDLVYGRATGVGSYGGDRVSKGGTLITINCRTGHYDWAALIPGKPKWKPRRGEQITLPEPKKH